jgi:hypothetical protein
MTGNRSGVSATRMRAQIILFGVTIAFVPADQGCRAERRDCARVLRRLDRGLRYPPQRREACAGDDLPQPGLPGLRARRGAGVLR